MKIALDVDGVLANFYGSVCKKYNQPMLVVNDFNLEWATQKMWDEIYNDYDLWENLIVLSPPQAITFEFDYYITHIPEHLLESRIKWLRDNGYPEKPVIDSDDKLASMRRLGVDILIDDKPEIVKEVNKAGLLAIQYVPYYYGNEMMVDSAIKVRHLPQVNNVLNLLKLK